MKRVVLDIDGVILKGGALIAGATDAIAKLQRNRIPYCFVTNGGGVTEAVKAAELSKKIGLPVPAEQVVVCHTPMKRLAAEYADEKVLILGKSSCLEVAEKYGFQRAVGVEQLHAEHPHIYPCKQAAVHGVAATRNDLKSLHEVKAAMIFHDPYDWGVEMQILSDVLAPLRETTSNNISTQSLKQRIPLFTSNNDLIYSTEFPTPRYTQGAFLRAFSHLYSTTYGIPLQVKYFGKPFAVQYEYAASVLRSEAQRVGAESEVSSSDVVYFGVGDNPKSDIRGANNAGHQWKSVLVRTGVFNDSNLENDTKDPADFVCNDLSAAVDLIVDFSS